MYLNQTGSYFSSDPEFDALYPVYVQQLSGIHWTPLPVAQIAATFLAPGDDARVLDIGAGVGKFCIAGGYYSGGSFTGIEHRKNFVTIGNKLIRQLRIDKVSLVHGNFTQIDMCDFTGIYFYNSFHENIVLSDSLDDKVERSPELYEKYTAHLHAQLNNMPIGTRLATYWLSMTEIPGCYKLHESHFDNLLKLWIKEY